jgi:DNA-directed RNA polymerase sigma subunit (sigma70/sigma32)
MASVVLRNGPDRDFSRYLREIDTIHSAEEPFGLHCRSRDLRDGKAAHGPVTSHLRLVAKIAAGCRDQGQRFDGWVGSCTMGAIKADGRHDPDRGFRMASHAMRWISAAAGHEVRLSGAARPVSFPTDVRGP